MLRYPGTSPVALTLTGATNRIPNRSPDKALRAAIRESSPGGAYAYRGYQPNTEPYPGGGTLRLLRVFTR
ncbi:TPA: hypothetical protein RFS88_004498 [Klebsiella aerogenes]|nr:hypothetical protein [Klebsiella aerogenes]